jgi:ATP synthase protein I
VKILPAKPRTTKSISVANSAVNPVINESMTEYSDLKLRLLLTTLVVAGVIFVGVWWVFRLNIALNYLLGACVGVVYLRMLAKSVDRLGDQNEKLGYSRLALFLGLIIVAIFWEQLKILPVFIGFITYKLAILVYTLQELTSSYINKADS